MNKSQDIYKASGIILRDRKVLVERSKGKAYFIHPGGKLESNETAEQAVIRELKEEFQIDVREENLELFGNVSAPAANTPEVDVHMTIFMVKKWRGEIKPDSEVEGIRWLNSTLPKDIKIGSIMEHETIPALKAKDLID
jgi:8-oxo-dGTP diphosphatase